MKKIYLAILAFAAVLLASWATTSVFLQQDEGTDLTSKITNPNLDDGLNGWTVVEASGQSLGVKATGSGNPVYTCYKGVFDIRQTITGLEPGLYTVKVQAFSRPTSNADAISIPEAEQENFCFIGANYVTQNAVALTSQWLTEKLTDWSEHTLNGQTIYLPNSSTAFAEAFKRGMYDNTLSVVVGSRGELTLSVTNTKASSSVGDTYSGFDNFRLYYEGTPTEVTEAMESGLLKDIPSGTMSNDVQAAMEAALKAYKASKSAADFMSLIDAVDNALVSIEAYKLIASALDDADKATLSESGRGAFKAAIADILAAYQNHTLKGDGKQEAEAIKAALAKAIEDDVSGSDDKTALLKNPNLNDGLNGWTVVRSEGGSVGVKAADTGNPVYTCYNGVFDIYQTLTDLTPGTYKVQVQAFSRPCEDSELDALLKSGKELENFCYIYANDEEIQPVQLSSQWLTSAGSGSWASHTFDGKTIYLPNNSGAFADAFKKGMYDNELLVPVRDGKLTIGIRNETAKGTQGVTYTGFDNFRLTYVSSEIKEETEAEETVADLIAKADACKTVAAQAADHAAFDEAYTATLAVYNNAEASEEAIAAAKESLMAAFRTLLKDGTTETGQFDLTALITNPTFDKNADGWEMSSKVFKQNSIGVLQGQNITDGAQMMQVLKGMPAGKYILKVQGFYQAQAWKQALYDYEHGLYEGKLSLTLNNESKRIKSIFDDARNTLASACQSRVEDVGSMVDGRGFPLLLDKVSESLTPGGYWNYVEATVTADGDVTIGVTLDATTLKNNWVILDNFRLYYGERKPIVVKTSVPVTDDTPAEVMIVPNTPFSAEGPIPFSAPCDIPGSKFKAVYEIGSLDATTARKAVLFPVENVRAGIPCYVEFAEQTDTLFVGQTVLKPEKPDTYQINWDGGAIYPYYSGMFNWRMTEFKKATRPGSFFTTVEIQDLNNMNITGNIENYQVRMFMNQKYTQSSSSVVSTYNAIVPARRDLPHAIGIPVPASKAEGATVKYSLNADMSDAKEVAVINAATICYLTNLIPDNKYYFAVESAGKAVVKGELNVEGPVRMLYAPSVYNLRDLGGWTVEDGKTIRYGLLYRGGEVNGYHAPVFNDLKSLMALGIGAEIDLRWRDDYDQDRETNKSGYGFVKGDTYYFAGANDYTAANLSEAATLNRFKEEFHFLMKHIRQGRGVHFHCVFGADRTGLLAVLLEGLLGMDLNSLYHDYEFTSFAAPAGNRNKSAIQERIAVVQKESGSTLRDKFENFWIGKIGITKADVDEFRSIMLVDPIETAIKDVELQEKEGQQSTVKAVYNLNGVEVPQHSLNNRGTYVVRYSNGTSRKVVVK
jgi:protein-tyrosine phosphatase